MEDVAEDCEFLGNAGYLGVKIFSPTESLLSNDLTECIGFLSNLKKLTYITDFQMLYHSIPVINPTC